MDFVLWNEGTFLEKLMSGICSRIRRITEKIGNGNRAAEMETEKDEKALRAFHQNAERLLDTHGSAVLRMAYSYLHNMSDAEDILQETLIKYLKIQPELEGPEHEKAWLLRVAANLSKNRLDYNRLRDTD